MEGLGARVQAENAEKELRQNGWTGRILVYLKSLGYGLVTGASDDDPSGIDAYSHTGAQFGYMQLSGRDRYLSLIAAVQEMFARIGLHTDRCLLTLVRTSAQGKSKFQRPAILAALEHAPQPQRKGSLRTSPPSLPAKIVHQD